MTYTVHPTTHQRETRYVVRTPDGRIANGYYHRSPADAERHAHNCNVIIGRLG